MQRACRRQRREQLSDGAPDRMGAWRETRCLKSGIGAHLGKRLGVGDQLSMQAGERCGVATGKGAAGIGGKVENAAFQPRDDGVAGQFWQDQPAGQAGADNAEHDLRTARDREVDDEVWLSKGRQADDHCRIAGKRRTIGFGIAQQ